MTGHRKNLKRAIWAILILPQAEWVFHGQSGNNSEIGRGACGRDE
jgi:hypothetical protein